jgi:hypothetical protein
MAFEADKVARPMNKSPTSKGVEGCLLRSPGVAPGKIDAADRYSGLRLVAGCEHPKRRGAQLRRRDYAWKHPAPLLCHSAITPKGAAQILSRSPSRIFLVTYAQFAHRMRTPNGSDLPGWTSEAQGSGVCQVISSISFCRLDCNRYALPQSPANSTSAVEFRLPPQ